MQIIIDATALNVYPVGRPGFHGGTELYLHYLAHGLSKNHTVDVVTPDLAVMQRRGPQLCYWPPTHHPQVADAVIMFHNLRNLEPYHADYLIWASNGLGAYLGPNDEFVEKVDAIPCFSRTHAELLCQRHKKVNPDKCYVTGLGVDLDDFKPGNKVPGRLLYANDPQRGLLNTLRIFEQVLTRVPTATLHVTYDVDRVFEERRWIAHSTSQELWEIQERMKELGEHVVNLKALERGDLIEEMRSCYLHVYPSAPPNSGSQIHGITQMELAACGVPLILSNTEAFPEVFGEAAEILPVPGALIPEWERRCTVEDWTDLVVDTMQYDKVKYDEMSQLSRALAEANTWDHVVQKWEAMLGELAGVPA